MRFKSTILKEQESSRIGYDIQNMKEIAGDFVDESVFIDSNSMSIEKVVGVVEEADYEEGVGVVIEAEIIDEDIASLIEKGHVDIAPRLVQEELTGKEVTGVDGLFTTPRPDSNIGKSEVIEE